MNVLISEKAKDDPKNEIRVGIASWDKDHGGKNECISVKYAWPNKNGIMSRGGEVPVEALPQMLEFAIKGGYLKVA